MNPAQLQKMMKQAQKLQGEMQGAQQELDQKEFTSTAGGGAVSVVMKGNKSIVSISLSDEMIDVEEKEMLQEMIKSVINNLITEIDTEIETTMSSYTQGLPF